MLTPETVDRISDLARLALTASERDRIAAQLDTILDYVDQLQRLDVGAVAPEESGRADTGGRPYGAIPIRSGPPTLVLRDDVAAPSLPRDVALANAPAVIDGQVRVPSFLPDAP